MVPKCYAVQYIVGWEENPQNAPFPLRLRHLAGGGPSHGHRQHAHKLVKIAPVVREMCSRTDTQTYSLQYFATSPADEVTISQMLQTV